MELTVGSVIWHTMPAGIVQQVQCWLIVEVVRRMKVKLKKARLLVTDVQQSCNHHQQVAAEANKQSRLALSDVCT